MLGLGIVSFGVALVATLLRNANASAKIGRSSVSLRTTRSAAGVNSICPFSLWKRTAMLPSVRSMPPSW